MQSINKRGNENATQIVPKKLYIKIFKVNKYYKKIKTKDYQLHKC